ncbi:MAG TPA: cytochrome c biogenesis protein CcdA [Acidimicrobiales bacterium]|nr:cytochrome c biogenesis protein CcdA [Acidimicrobiales bacterium]
MTTTSVTYFAAFGGGAVSSRSSCVPPLVPAYLSLITGPHIGEVQGGARRHLAHITRDTGMVIAGLSAVSVLLGLPATAVGAALSLPFLGALLMRDRLSWVAAPRQRALRSLGLESLPTLG